MTPQPFQPPRARAVRWLHQVKERRRPNLVERRNFKRQRARQASSFMSVQEAAQVLRIGEALAYRMANEYLNNGGASGIPCVRLGRRLLVSRRGLEDLAGLGTDRALSSP